MLSASWRKLSAGMRVSQLAERQITEWTKLTRRWISDLEKDEEIEGIYSSRTAGREINF